MTLAAAAAAAVGGVAAGAAEPAAGAGQVQAGHDPSPAAAAALFRHGIGAPWALRRAGVPLPGTTSHLNNVFCTAASNCWAVGGYQTGTFRLNQVLHWTGTAWSRVTVPNPGGTGLGSFSELWSVRCMSATDCWAVGDFRKNNGPDLDQALHWNGKAWSKVSTPAPGGTGGSDFNDLFDVVCSTATRCWAVGQYGSGSGSSEVSANQVLRWNGTKWSVTSVPNPGGTSLGHVNALSGVRCPSASSCLAVGDDGTVKGPFVLRNQALRWNGSTWSKLTTPNPGGTADGDFSELVGLGCATATNCWAAGAYGMFAGAGTTALNQVLHWNGTAWIQQATPNPDGTGEGASNFLFSANCTSATSCWAVGEYGSMNGGVGVILNEALRWNGSAWSLVSTPDPGGTGDGASNSLSAVRCTSASSCWAVGSRAKVNLPPVNEALRWNGSTWSTG